MRKKIFNQVEEWNSEHPEMAYPVEPSASEEEIKLLQDVLKEKYAYQLTEEYLNFLRKCNGFTFNGLTVCGTKQVKDSKGTVVVESLLGITEYIRKDLGCQNLIGLGEGNESFLVYDIATQQFQYRDESIDTIIGAFNSFGELINSVSEEECIF